MRESTSMALHDAPVAEQLAAFATGLDWQDIPPEVAEKAKYHILDSLGIALAACQFEFAHRATAAIRSLAEPGPSMLIGNSTGLPLRDAVMLNGLYIHGLDFDDTHSEAVVHVSSSALPVALGMSQKFGASGKELILAYLLGIEASARIGAAARSGFQQVGFHPTGMVGAFGATLTAGRLRKSPTSAVAAAQGIVLSMAAGSLEFLSSGAWTKRFHPGWAGVCAITASELAYNGFTSPPLPYEGRFGLFKSHLDKNWPYDMARATAALGQDWEMMNVALKPYPACHFNHAFADAALALQAAHAIDPKTIKRICARISADQVKFVCEPAEHKKAPRNSYDAQFSVQYMVAATLFRGRFTLDELDETAIRDKDVLDLAARVDYEIDPHSLFPDYYSGELVIEMADGRVLTHREEKNRGSDARPLTSDDIISKFISNAGRVLPGRELEPLIHTILDLDRLEQIDPLLRSLSR